MPYKNVHVENTPINAGMDVEMGFVHEIKIYSVQENDPKFRVLVKLLLGLKETLWLVCQEKYQETKKYKLYLGRFYASLPLAVCLWKQGIQSLSTIQWNRIPTFKFQYERELKKVPRGYSEKYLTHVELVVISTVLCKDNSNVWFFFDFCWRKALNGSQEVSTDRRKSTY